MSKHIFNGVRKGPIRNKSWRLFPKNVMGKKGSTRNGFNSSILFLTYERAHTRKGVYRKPKKGGGPMFPNQVRMRI